MEDRKAQLFISVFLLGLGVGSLGVFYGLKKYIERNKKKIEDKGFNDGAIETHENFKQLLKWAATTGTDATTLYGIVQSTENNQNK